MSDAQVTLDAAWLRAHPLPVHGDVDKNERGRVLLIGGSARVPGGMRLTAEAAFQSGAGKVRLAVQDMLAIPLGVLLPEAGTFGPVHGRDRRDCEHRPGGTTAGQLRLPGDRSGNGLCRCGGTDP